MNFDDFLMRVHIHPDDWLIWSAVDWSGLFFLVSLPRYSVFHNGNHVEQKKKSLHINTDSYESCLWPTTTPQWCGLQGAPVLTRTGWDFRHVKPEITGESILKSWAGTQRPLRRTSWFSSPSSARDQDPESEPAEGSAEPSGELAASEERSAVLICYCGSLSCCQSSLTCWEDLLDSFAPSCSTGSKTQDVDASSDGVSQREQLAKVQN